MDINEFLRRTKPEDISESLYEELEDIFPSSPRRYPDWRWKLVKKFYKFFNNEEFKEVLKENQIDIETDPSIQRAILLYVNLPEQNRLTQNKFINYIKSVPKELRISYRIYDSGNLETEHGLLKSALESYLLTAVPLKYIDTKLSLPGGTAAIYHDLFFSVRDKLTNSVWILDRIFGTSLLTGVPIDKYYNLWKFYAYFGGIDILEKIISLSPQTPAEGVSIDKFIEEEVKQILLFKAALFARSLQVDEESTRTIFASLVKIFEIQSQSQPVESVTQEMGNLQAVYSSIQDFYTKLKDIPLKVQFSIDKNQQLDSKENASLLSLPNPSQNLPNTINNS